MFSKVNEELNEIWEDYVALDLYLQEVHKGVKDRSLDCVVIPILTGKPRARKLAPNAVYGIVDRIRTKTAGRHAFIDAVSLFENFMSSLVSKVYLDYPGKLRGFSQQSEAETGGRQQKLMEVIFESATREEMISKLVDEKVRGIFYGNPIDLFAKDKASVGFGQHFKDNCGPLLEKLKEITARRNVIIHNEGRIDRKYLAEVPGSALRIGQKVSIDREYLNHSLFLMKRLEPVSKMPQRSWRCPRCTSRPPGTIEWE